MKRTASTRSPLKRSSSVRSASSLDKTQTKRQKKAAPILNFKTDILQPKPSYKPVSYHENLFKLTNYTPVTRQELQAKIDNETLNGLRKTDDEERCPICFCDLFDEDSSVMPPDAVVLMGKCTDHCYHLGCLQRQLCLQTQNDG